MGRQIGGFPEIGSFPGIGNQVVEFKSSAIGLIYDTSRLVFL